MRVTFIVLLLAGLCLAAADVAFVCDDIGISVYSKFLAIAPIICDVMSESFTYEVITNNGDNGTYTSNTAWWNDYRVVIWYASGSGGLGRLTTYGEQVGADTFLNNGGWLMVTGYDVLGAPDDSTMAAIVHSSKVGDVPHESNCTIVDTNHFITNGPYGSFSGNYTDGNLDKDKYSPDSSAGSVEIIHIPYGTKMLDCAVGSSHVTGWNGNRSSSDWEIAYWANMARNWLAESLANTSSNIEETTWGQIKASL